jgi:L-lactate dehydrogenase complex protein LldG
MNTAREEILARIRAGLGRTQPSEPGACTALASLPRAYSTSGNLSALERAELFIERLRDYEVEVLTVSGSAIAAAVASRLTAHSSPRSTRRIAYPSGFPAAWLSREFEFLEGDALSPEELDRLDGVITACTLAIAETGTLVLQTAPAQGPRRLSLIPEYHLCVVEISQLVQTVPEALEQLAHATALPTTFISGPSATSDIEMTRVRGVHGPRTLEVILAME